MKHINKIAILIIAGIFLFSCRKEFLDQSPKDELTITTAFSTYESIEAYAWQFYSVFTGYSSYTPFNTERDADLGSWSRLNSESTWIWQKVVIPTNSDDYSIPFSNIRACNIMLDNLDASKISDTDKKHWRSVAYFFKAYNYAELINKYGDITWVENNLKDNDQATLFGPRTPRDTVAKKILKLLQYAEVNIKPDGDGPNSVNVNVVRALISRFGLREGTWRKYHGLSDADTYLNACVTSSEPLLTAFPNIMSNYSDVFTSASLAGKSGIILYKEYEPNVITHNLSKDAGSSSGYMDLTHKAINMYLMRDGQTRWTSPTFAGEDSPYKEFRNRDFRLYLTTCPPYQVIGPGTATTFTFTDNPADREYFPIMDSLSIPVQGAAVASSLNAINGSRTLPWRAWCAFVVDKVPHFHDNNRGKSWGTTFTGYAFSKFATRLNENVLAKDINDAPIFRIEEVMLNYAEAKKELGGFNQIICDETINKLRARGGVASLNLASIPNDPTRDLTVDPEMWEIRRERAIELMGEGFRFDDLRRWEKMDYATERKLGIWIVKADEANNVPTLNNADAGYVSYEGVPPTAFLDYYYLYPIPSNQIILTNSIVKQNPGWVQN
jgi:hypothetical protein